MQGSQAPVKQDLLQALYPVCQGKPLVLTVEEGGVLEAGLQDPLIPGPNDVGVFLAPVSNREETGQELAVAAVDRNILLMLPHAGGQDLNGEI